MPKVLSNALADKPWSVSALMFDIDDVLDDEGRPVSERRANVATRVGVEMEMRLCPFGGIRDGKWMNISALSQITKYYKDVMLELAAYRLAQQDESYRWQDTLACIVDLYAGPAIYLLQNRDASAPVPAKIAVYHKLAAGMFGVIKQIFERLVSGDPIPVTSDSFMQMIDDTGALVGTSEACAGSPKMIRSVVEAMMEAGAESDGIIDAQRLQLARMLSSQVQIATYWRLYDRSHLRRLLVGDFGASLEPSNFFLKQKLDAEIAELNKQVVHPLLNFELLADFLDAGDRRCFVQAINDTAAMGELQEDVKAAGDLLHKGNSAVRYRGDVETLAMSVAHYLYAYRLFKSTLCAIELQMRDILNYSRAVPVQLGGAAFPLPRAQKWYELVLGRNVGDDGHLTGQAFRAAGQS